MYVCVRVCSAAGFIYLQNVVVLRSVMWLLVSIYISISGTCMLVIIALMVYVTLQVKKGNFFTAHSAS